MILDTLHARNDGRGRQRHRSASRSRRARLAILITTLALVELRLAGCAYTPRIRPSDPTLVPIASLERVELGGQGQSVLIRGHDREAPILLFLHGGPGMPMMYLAHAFQREIEKDFVVVHWDQRGAGKSFSAARDPETIRMSQLLADMNELIDELRVRFGQERIFIAGHSFGSYLGLIAASRRPEVLHAFIGVGQVVDAEAARSIQREFIIETAGKRAELQALDDLRTYGAGAHEKWLWRFNGQLANATSYGPLINAGLSAPEYTLFDALRVKKGSDRSSRLMQYDILQGAPRDTILELEVPIFFVLGERDYVTPSELGVAYLSELDAPMKALYWCGQSAHFPFFEQPDRFATILREIRDRVLAAEFGDPSGDRVPHSR